MALITKFCLMITIVSALVLAPPFAAMAEESGENPDSSKPPGHILGDHRFLPSFFFLNPFAVPTFEFDLGLAYGTFSREMLGTSRDLKVGSVGPKIEAQIKLVDRLMLIVAASGNVGFGLNGESVGLYGAASRYQPRLGLLWGVLKTERSVLSLGLDWEKTVTVQSSPIDFVTSKLSDLLGGPDIPSENLVEVTRWKPTVRFAQALSPAIGIAAFGGLNFIAENFNSIASRRTQFMLGASLDVDFKPVPIGLTFNYRFADLISSGVDPSHLYTIGLFENFSPRFNFGVEVGRMERGDQWSTLGAFVTRYYY